ncbi:hypothetical protein A2U94_05435 [Bacillus sp. VT 712]|uniref:hypothetical protein n=1 Tax=Bacillaceae TaxID=186817 RepID=UPI000473EF77|nr:MULTISPECIES: hypothetical protein [Bacillaceae]KZB92459.1 hypothetical protein A2U94_05435 [Bacillus sp. VT 712]
MTNLFIDCQQSRDNKYFRYNSLNGLNKKGSGQSKIKIVGHLDHFTKKTLYENYDIIAQNLKAYPTITIYPREYELKGGFGGFYHPDKNHIEIIDHFYLISMLAHEMRHAFQYIYIPDIYFNITISSAREYFNCHIERDAREYAIDYCIVREYWEEAEYRKKDESEIELVIRNQLSPSVRGLSDDYFRRNPSTASIVPRSYHYDQNSSRQVAASSGSSQQGSSEAASGCVGLIVIAAIVIYLIYKFI